MKRLLLSLPLVALGAAGVQEASGRVQEAEDPARRAAAVFAERCVSCHVPPDPAFAVDRAWLHQLADTA